MRNSLYVVFVTLFFTVGCSSHTPEGPKQKTQLEIREFQTRLFQVDDVRLVMKSVLNVLQDESYIVKNVALDLGFLTATKEIDIEEPSSRMWARLGAGHEARWAKHEIIEATVNVTEFGKEMRVRANFQSKKLDNMGGVIDIHQITDEKFYQEFFAKVSKGIFLQEQNI